MIGIRENHKNEALNDIEWENMGSFISNFAKNNESVTDDMLIEKSDFTKSNKKRNELSEKVDKLKKNVEKSSLKSAHTSKNSQNSSGVYDALHSDIRSLLDELQEIKQARIDLQSKLNTIRQ